MVGVALAIALLNSIPVTDIQSRIPKTRLVISMDLPTWKEDNEALKMLRGQLGDKAIMAGSLLGTELIFSVISEDNPKNETSAQWRTRFRSPGEAFEVGGVACVGNNEMLAEGMYQEDFHAYVLAEGLCFDLHMSQLTQKDITPTLKKVLSMIVQSFRLQFFRRGWGEDYPNELRTMMHAAATAYPNRKAWVEQMQKEHADDWKPSFIDAEFSSHEKRPAAEQSAAYRKALELLAKLKTLTPQEKFAWAMACEGIATSLWSEKKVKDAIPPLKQGLKLLEELNRPERSGFFYNLACAYSLGGDSQGAMDNLAKAIEIEPRYKDSAKKDEDFKALKNSKIFQDLLNKP